ncbi:MAG TPA: VOC family protein, partial [Candidatus Dormibacteraeota bacterium]|nr:VOC family protein [Candidatus Dormibacteraeota bacterium]
DPDQPEPAEPRPFAIDVIDRPRLTAWVAKSSELEAAAAKAAQHQYDLGPILDMTRSTPDGRVLRWRLTKKRASVVTVIPLLIDWGGTLHPSVSSPGGATLVSLSAEDPNPDHVRQVLAALGLELAVTSGHEPRLVAQLSGPAGRLDLS